MNKNDFSASISLLGWTFCHHFAWKRSFNFKESETRAHNSSGGSARNYTSEAF